MDFRRNRKRHHPMNWSLLIKFKNNISKKKTRNITTFSEHLDKQYGKRRTKKREKYEQEFEAFKLGVMLQELRKELGMTQEQLAAKCGTTKTYIS